MKKKVLAIVLSMCLVLAFCACGSTEGTATDDGSANQQTFTWKVQGYCPAGTYLDDMGKSVADKITAASGGRLTIDWYAVDSIVSVSEGGNAVRDGILDAVFDYSGLYTSLNDAFALFCSSPGMFPDCIDMYTWMQQEGLDLWQQMWDEYGMNGHLLIAGLMDQEDFLWSKKPIHEIEDLQGMTIRMMPIMGTILSEHDISVAFVSASEIITSMEKGVLDAGEYAIPVLDRTFGFQDVAKYYVRPGVHQPTAVISLNVNNDRWNELPDDLKAIVEECCQSNALEWWAKGIMLNIEAVDYFKSLGIEECILSDDAINTMLGWIDQWYDENCPTNEWLAKVRESQVAHIDKIAEFKDSLSALSYPDWAYSK